MPFPSVVSEVWQDYWVWLQQSIQLLRLIRRCWSLLVWQCSLPKWSFAARILGMAMTAIFLSMLQENIAAFWWVSIFFKRLNTKITARIQLTPWHRKVAHATPSTPLEKTGESTVTNKISIPILEREEIIRKIKGVLESPRAEKIPVATL